MSKPNTVLKFGTDGVRGRANTELTSEFVLLLGRASARRLGASRWLIGWDTRQSSPMLASAFAAGVASEGADITALGELPTAGVSLTCRSRGLPGAMVTASHNPYTDNGIKLFGADGVKLREDVERDIERDIDALLAGDGLAGPRATDGPGGETGRISWHSPPGLRDEYQRWLLERARKVDASGLTIGVDCANGAAYRIAPKVIAATGARVRRLACRPDGRNINVACGSTHPQRLRSVVRAGGLDLGLAFDGDADRLLAVDSGGQIVDGDEIIAILANHRAQRGLLPLRGVVVTQWSNQGLLKGLRQAGLRVQVCPVGDKSVADALEATGFALGGEQSGHIIMKDLLPVGDGTSTAIELLAAVAAAGRPLREIASQCMTKWPQRTEAVRVTAAPAQVVGALEREQARLNAELGEGGRLILRASGTEPVVRVMAEAEDPDRVAELVAQATELIRPYT